MYLRLKKLKCYFVVLVFVFSCTTISTQVISHGKILESKSFESTILRRPVAYSIYLPPDYELSNRSYPVLYLLHGFTDNETAWVQFGEANVAADIAIAERNAPPMIIVMPDAGVSWYINDYLGKTKYEDMFFKEFIPYIEKNYRIRSAKEFRAVGGLSMGGYGALIYSFRHPEMFSSCVALSAGVHTDSEAIEKIKNRKNFYQEVYGPMNGDSLPAHWEQSNVLDLARNLPKDTLSLVKYYIDCGDKDAVIIGNCELNLIMVRKAVPHEFRVREGAHNWTYWRTGIADGLKFIGQSFHR
jgi:S-formylglutathione hydrolase FrmB